MVAAHGLVEQFARARRRHDAALRKGDDLDRHPVAMRIAYRHDLLEIPQSDLRIDIDVAAHMGRSLRDAEFDQTRGAHGNRLRLGKLLLLEFNPFADIEARSAGPMGFPLVADEALVEMNVAVDETRQHETTVEIQGFTRRHGTALIGGDRGDAAIPDGDIDNASIGQSCISKQGVEFSQLKSPKKM